MGFNIFNPIANSKPAAAASAQNWLLIAIVIVATGLSLVKKIHPLWVMLFGAMSGALFL